MKSSKLANSILGGALASLIFLSIVCHPGTKRYLLDGHFDFIIFYTAGEALKEGQAKRLYNYETQKEIQRTLTGRPRPLPFNHPAYESLLFVPLAFLPYLWAYRIWGLVNFLLVGVSAYLLRAYLHNVRRLSLRVVFMMASFIPLSVGLLQGQDSILMLLLFTLAFLSLKQHQDSKAGCFLALALMKFQLVLPFVAVFFVKRRWKTVVPFLIVAFLLGVVSLGLVGWGGVEDWVHLIWRENQNLPIGNEFTDRTIVPEAMGNLRGFLYAMLAGRMSPGLLDLVVGACSAALLIWSFTKWTPEQVSSERGFELLLALNLIITLLVSYHLYMHDLALISLPILIVFSSFEVHETPNSLHRLIFIGATLLLFVVGVFVFGRGAKAFWLLFWPVLTLAFTVSGEITGTRQRELAGSSANPGGRI
jgi:glycosyl transferase family 87